MMTGVDADAALRDHPHVVPAAHGSWPRRGPQRRIVHSFDVFDTLLARSVRDPTDVFDLVERAGVPNFKSIRLKAQETSDHTWADIYRRYAALTGLGSDDIAKIQAMELQAEKNVSYLIRETYEKVRDGDILVSDNYLNEDLLIELLRSVGFEKDVHVYVTPASKATGEIWPMIQQYCYIANHTGDNAHSDVASPGRYGIPTTPTSVSLNSPAEALFNERDCPTTGQLLRRFRLSNPHPSGSRAQRLHALQASHNIPFLLLMSKQLRETMDREGLKRILFSTRDSCLLRTVFETLYPEAESVEFQTSRIAYDERRASYIDYIKSVYRPGESLIFDLHGAFKTGRDLFVEVFGEAPRVHIFVLAIGRAPGARSITFDLQGGPEIELLNLDHVGPLITVLENGEALRAPLLDYDVEIPKLYRRIVDEFVTLMRTHAHEIRDELMRFDGEIPWLSMGLRFAEAVRIDPDLGRMDLPEHRSLTQWADLFSTDKGSRYMCAHHYTQAYERILRPFHTRERFSLLEIGLNRDANDTIPSLNMWRAYFGSRVTLHGFDINAAFSRHHQPERGLSVIIGDQSDPADLMKCRDACPEGFDVIIDDGYHASRHQQVSLKHLWRDVRPGGLYIIEDLHYQPVHDGTMDTRDLLAAWAEGKPIGSAVFSEEDAKHILSEVSEIVFFDSLSRIWPPDSLKRALAVIFKR